jgi:hypothetical protein
MIYMEYDIIPDKRPTPTSKAEGLVAGIMQAGRGPGAAACERHIR